MARSKILTPEQLRANAARAQAANERYLAMLANPPRVATPEEIVEIEGEASVLNERAAVLREMNAAFSVDRAALLAKAKAVNYSVTLVSVTSRRSGQSGGVRATLMSYISDQPQNQLIRFRDGSGQSLVPGVDAGVIPAQLNWFINNGVIIRQEGVRGAYMAASYDQYSKKAKELYAGLDDGEDETEVEAEPTDGAATDASASASTDVD